MKTFLKLAGGVVLVVLVVLIGAIGWLSVRKPASQPPSSEKIEATPERLARGEYLVKHVTDCLGCYSDHLLTFGMPLKPGTEGQGGFTFDKKLGIPGVVAAQNITQDPETGLGRWSDGEMLRAIREGVDRKGDALFPMMPYEHFRDLSDEDAKSIVLYIRTLKGIRHIVPAKAIDFPVNLLVKFAPKPVGRVANPDPNDSVAYGRYLTSIAGCVECHSPHDDKNQVIAGREFSGGWKMVGPWGTNVTANLTPHPATWVGSHTRAEFIGRFRAFQTMSASSAPACPKGRNTIMPWLAFSNMTDHDLGAIYDYLKSLKPIENRVNSFPDAG